MDTLRNPSTGFELMCRACGGYRPLEMTRSLATDGATEIFGLTCKIHGRVSAWYESEADALGAVQLRTDDEKAASKHVFVAKGGK
jgi:hypothetical protein